MSQAAAGISSRRSRWELLLLIGPLALFLGAASFGVLEVHSSTDTWIGLAAGRQILTSDEFPTTDTFSFTFNGKVWYNQNWLTHLYQYWLYSHVSPNAVIYGAWTLAACVFIFTLFGAYWRSGTWMGALICASIVGIGGRDFLSARPATTGYFCIAALWALVCALDGQGEKRRRWPIVLLLPLLLIWGNAHGSFIFGYGVLTLYVGHWFVTRTMSLPKSWLYNLAAVLVITLIGGVIYSVAPEGAKAAEITTVGAVTYYKSKIALVCCAFFGYVIYWLCVRFFKSRPAISDRQAYGIVGAMLSALALTIAFGPFHLANFTHGEKIASSSVFRQVSEWNPPFQRSMVDGHVTLKPDLSEATFPPMGRFWTIFHIVTGVLFASLLFWGTARALKLKPPEGSARRHTSLFDVALIIIGISMTFWARRFAPIFYIFAFPVFLVWIVNLTRMTPGIVRLIGKYALSVGAAVGACIVIWSNWERTHLNLVEKFEGGDKFNLLERVTRYDTTPHDTILFLRENKLNVNIVTEWTQAGPVMFFAPNAKVFMDGRAQQVYDEKHYMTYASLLLWENTPPSVRVDTLNRFGVDAILLRHMKRTLPLQNILEQSGEWIPVLASYGDTLYMRKDSAGFKRLVDLLREGKEWRPRTAPALAARGFIWEAADPPNIEAALDCWSRAVRQNMYAGRMVFRKMTRVMVEHGMTAEAGERIQEYHRFLSQRVPGMREQTRQLLLQELTDCWGMVQAAEGGAK